MHIDKIPHEFKVGDHVKVVEGFLKGDVGVVNYVADHGWWVVVNTPDGGDLVFQSYEVERREQ